MSGTLPLFEKYPALSGLPHVRLGLFPTPVQELHGLSESDNISQMTHIVGGLCGVVFGFSLARAKKR